MGCLQDKLDITLLCMFGISLIRGNVSKHTKYSTLDKVTLLIGKQYFI